MRQAIEEGFILDVLRQLRHLRDVLRKLGQRSNRRRPGGRQGQGQGGAGPVRGAAPAPAGAEGRDDRRALPRDSPRRLGGRAKAMVVTAVPRARACEYYQAHHASTSTRAYTDCGVLVAFSGTLDDLDGERVHRGAAQRVLRGAAAGDVRLRQADDHAGRRGRASTSSWSSPRSTRPASTSRCCTTCTSTRS